MPKIKRLHKAVLLIILSALFFAFMGIFVRLAGDVPDIQKVFFRNLFALFLACGVMIKNRCSLVPPKQAVFPLVMRAVCGYAGVICNFYALSRLATVSDALLLNKMSPFFAVIFSAVILKERAGPVRWLIILAAFGGALFVIKPSFDNPNLLASAAGFLGGVGAGAAYAFVRSATSKGAKGYYVVFFFSAFSTLASLPVVLLDYSPMSVKQLLFLVGAGVSAAGGQFCITAAYSLAPAREVSIYDYSQIIFAALLGFLIMGEIPDGWSFIGYAVIIGAAFVMFRYNNRKED